MSTTTATTTEQELKIIREEEQTVAPRNVAPEAGEITFDQENLLISQEEISSTELTSSFELDLFNEILLGTEIDGSSVIVGAGMDNAAGSSTGTVYTYQTDFDDSDILFGGAGLDVIALEASGQLDGEAA